MKITDDLRIRNPGPNSINTTLSSDTVYGNVVATGGATSFLATIGVTVLVPKTTLLKVSSDFLVINSQAGPRTSVASVTVQDPTNPLYTFSATPALNDSLTITVTGVPLTTAVKDPAVVARVDPVVVRLVPAIVDIPPTPDLTQAVAAIIALNTPTAVAYPIAQLAPSISSLAAPLVLPLERSRLFQNFSMSHLDVCRGDNRYDEVNPQTCRDNNDRRANWWEKGIAFAGEQGATQNTFGYDSRVYGGMIGYDMPLGHDTRAGLGMGYTRSKIDGNRFASQTKFDSWMGVLYAGHENGPWYIHGNASVGWDDCSGKRIILYPGVDRVASADFKGMDYSVYANLGYHYNATPEVRIIPNVSLHCSHLNLDGYKEKGAGDLNLKVNSQKCDFTESGVGLRM